VEELIEVLRILNNKEYFDLIAKLNKTALDSYVAAGFTREEAMKFLLQINIAQNLQSK
jgi:hypothetical protein